MKHCNTTNGFSLIEMLVYVAVIVFISTAVVVTYLSLDTVLARNHVERQITKAGSTAMERMVRAVRDGSTVNLTERTLPSELAVDQALSTTTEFYLSGGQIYIDVNDVPLGPITPSAVTIRDLTFHHYELTGTPLESETVRIFFTAHMDGKGASTTKTFYSSAVLRDSYE